MAEVITTLAQSVNAQAVYQVFQYTASFIAVLFFAILSIYLLKRLLESSSKGEVNS